ncbi:MAG: DUF192 domain-containing protein [Candidatus Paceibacterota bacterium]|jgi:hypothetical protein
MKKITLAKLSNLSKKEKKVAYFVIIFFLITLSVYSYNCFSEKVCGVNVINKFVRHDVTIIMPNGSLVAEVVDTNNSRELGLSGRNSISDDEGMLFIFDSPGRYGFWMKDMNFPLDILWINQNGIVVAVESNLKPDSYPKTFINSPEASYVLEINAGRAEKYGIFLGSKVILED